MKANKFTELDSETIKEYENYIGKDGRIIILEQTSIGRAFARPLGDKPPRHMLIRVKDGKAHIVGVGGR